MNGIKATIIFCSTLFVMFIIHTMNQNSNQSYTVLSNQSEKGVYIFDHGASSLQHCAAGENCTHMQLAQTKEDHNHHEEEKHVSKKSKMKNHEEEGEGEKKSLKSERKKKTAKKNAKTQKDENSEEKTDAEPAEQNNENEEDGYAQAVNH